MTQNHSNGNNAPTTDLPEDATILQTWYAYAAQQPGSIGSLLQLLRTRQQKSEEQHRREFEVNAPDFAKLQSMRAPRPDRFHSDAERIAEACHVGKVFHFVQTLLLARNVATLEQTERGEVYEAAFDAEVADQGFRTEDE